MIAPKKKLITRIDRRDDEDQDMRPLDMRLISRLYRYTQPHAAKRNALLWIVVLRALQIPCHLRAGDCV